MQKVAELNLDKIDKVILTELQRDGRLANVQLAARVGLSESACLRRVRALEESGAIDQYVMLVNQAAIGKPGNVLVRVSLEGQQKEKLAGFEEAIKNVPEVMECYLMSGEIDYQLRIVVRNAADYERLHNELTSLPGVLRIHSSFALRTVLKKTEIPIS
ncbi:MAG: AsnC family transcriptional regulator [Desulfuromonas sp.]|nr:MAG: AsnC family transcriptional regulator [Desulfuromonas sp.]